MTELRINRKALVPNGKQLAAEGQRIAVVVPSRGDWTRLELFVAGVIGWPKPLVSIAKKLAEYSMMR